MVAIGTAYKKGEGKSINYTFRMHDPRVGKFLSIDPLIKEYPHYGPYVFSENRVVDGKELEGAEYLWYQESLIEMQNGDLYMKLENFSKVFKKELEKIHGHHKIALTDYQVKNSPLLILPGEMMFVFDNEELEMDENETEILNKNEYNINRSQSLKKNGQPKKNSKESSSTAVVDAPVAKASAIVFFALLDVDIFIFETYQGKIFSDDLIELSHQTQSIKYYNRKGEYLVRHISAFERAYSDINKAIEKGWIPKEFMTPVDLGSIFNIVLYGGNGNEGEKIREIGQKILNNITGDQRGLEPSRTYNEYTPVNGLEAEKPKQPKTAINDQKCIK